MASYLARSGLRVVLFEEEALAKRPLLLREPFLPTGLEVEGPIERVFSELGVPLGERRQVARSQVSLQVALPGCRIDVGPGIDDRPFAVFRASRIPPNDPGLAGRVLVPLDPQPAGAPAPTRPGDLK